MKIITRPAAIRVACILALLAGLSALAWYNMVRMPLKSFTGTLPALTASQQALSTQLARHVRVLAGEIGERNVFTPGHLTAAANYIEWFLQTNGYTVQRQNYEVLRQTCANLEIEIAGAARRSEIVVVGAHYDSVAGSPGANDNASGVAAMLVLAEMLKADKPARTLRFVGFVNEEPPHFQTTLMGSAVYARRSRERGERIVAMLSLETMAYFSDAQGSQKYPFPLGLLYPSRGNFIGFVGNTASTDLVRACIARFRQAAAFPSEGAALPAGLPGIGWSDHWAFWQEHYPAVMITDTAPFRYPHYHTAEDTPDQLDYDRLARVTEGIITVIRGLANDQDLPAAE